jgi:hypothetical protein
VVPAAAAAHAGSRPAALARAIASRVAYWTPVLAALVLFAQVSFLGLRPSLREAERLSDAAVDLEARHAQDRALYAAYEVQLAARRDPIFRERQDRLRRARPVAGVPSGT